MRNKGATSQTSLERFWVFFFLFFFKEKWQPLSPVLWKSLQDLHRLGFTVLYDSQIYFGFMKGQRSSSQPKEKLLPFYREMYSKSQTRTYKWTLGAKPVCKMKTNSPEPFKAEILVHESLNWDTEIPDPNSNLRSSSPPTLSPFPLGNNFFFL